MSTISETDVRVFAELSNPLKTNLDRIKDGEKNGHLDEVSEGSDEENGRSERNSRVSHCSQSYAPSQIASQVHSHVPSHAYSHVSNSKQYEDPDDDDDDDDEEQDKNDDDEEDDEIKSQVSRSSRSSKAESLISKAESQLSRRKSNISKTSVKSNGFSPFANHMNKSSSFQLPTMGDHKSNDTEILEKQSVLMDMERLKMQGIKLSKEWSIDDRLDDMMFEVKRHMIHLDELNNINMMRDGMRLLCSGFEMFNGKIGILELDGWSAEVCSDIHKYDTALGKIYRKYWRKTSQTSPEMEIIIGLIGSVGMFHFKRKLSRKIPGMAGLSSMGKMPSMSGMNSFTGSMPKTAPSSKQTPRIESDDDSSDSEDLPP